MPRTVSTLALSLCLFCGVASAAADRDRTSEQRATAQAAASRDRASRTTDDLLPASPAPPARCPVNDSWDTSLTSVPGSEPNAGHFAVWTGTEMIVWSREGGARFNPRTGIWRFLPPVVGPKEGAAIWTGHELILWGRFGTTGWNISTGGVAYDPAADSWRAIPRPAFVNGKQSSVIWTGKEMIVWGGNSGSDRDFFRNSGGRYDPALDRWSPTTQAGAPVERAAHSAVWTGSEMIVWGGAVPEGKDPLTGGRYDPATDTWRPISNGGPGAYETPAVWNGREMLVFAHQTVAYDPAADAWRPLPTTLAPFPRSGATYTRAGDSVIVWGGWDTVRMKAVNTGSRYDAVTDTWTPLSNVNAPSPRQGHSAVWTGDSLIVWGGLAPAWPAWTATGGTYYFENDRDRDGATVCGGDCDDADAAVHPGAIELPGNRLDEDCDGALLCDPDAPWRSRGEFLRCFASECRGLGDTCDDIRGLTSQSSSCGNGAASEQEVCDGSDLGGLTCADVGFDGGALACNAYCSGFETAGCSTVCGNQVRNGQEVCDGGDLAGTTCVSLGFDGGALACHRSCQEFDRSGCSSLCGDGARAGAEVCDGEDLGGRTCVSLGFDSGLLGCNESCTGLDASHCTTRCGNGVREPGEVCDGEAGGLARSCGDLGFEEGALRCLPTCDGFDPSGCAECGDGVKGGTEICDQSDFGASSCETQGFDGGSLTCDDDCKGWTIDRCIGCGNGRIDGDELCDGRAFTTSCVALGFDTGSLKCNRTCDAVDSTGCAHVPPSTAVCGDGVKEGDEKCDFLDFGGATCASSGFDGGELICSYDCRKISTPLCTTICGDGIRKGAELCDGEAFKDTDYRKCTRFGYDSGSVSCNKSCNGYDLSACSKCGDLVLEGNEACEANDHGGRTCESLGFIGGTLACDDCRLITNGCTTRCGDGLAQGYEVCDAPDLKGRTCESGGYDSGTLGCQANCIQFDYSGCRSTCGNGVTGPREVCDGTDVNGSCRQEGFDGGRIACNATCSGYDTTACTTCGNGLLEPGEVCDGEDLGGWTCRLFGYSGGTLRCAACTGFDESGCTAN